MIKISLVHSVAFVWLGKFAAPSKNWRHVSRKLFEYELMIVDSGTLYIANEEDKWEVAEGEYLLMRPCERQYGYQSSECSFHWIHFLYNEAFNELDGDYIRIPRHGKISDLYRLEKRLTDIYSAWQKYQDRHYASYLTTALLLELYNQVKTQLPEEMEKETKKQLRAGQSRKVVSEIKKYIRWNCYVTTKVSEIARHLGYSEKYISSKFKEETGLSIREYLSEVIVEQAKEALLNSDYNVSEIAYSFGFSDAQNLSRLFKKVSGITPTEFRNQFMTIYENE